MSPLRVLVTGPSGSGKSTLARYFVAHGRHAFDADVVPGLCEWVDLDGRRKNPTEREWSRMKGVQFFWNEAKLSEILRAGDEVYLFGSCDNLDRFLDRFERRFYLRASVELISQRLGAPDRDNDFGQNTTQRSLVLASLAPEEAKARRQGFVLLEAGESPAVLYDRICADEAVREG